MALTVVDLPDYALHTGNEISVVLETDLALSTPNLKIALALSIELVYGSGTYVLQPAIWLDPDANGQCKFFIERYLADCFERELDIPQENGTTITLCDHVVRRYKMFAAEHSGEPQVVTDDILSGSLTNVRYAFHGGIPVQHFISKSYFGGSGWAVNELGWPLPIPFPPLPGVPPFMDWRGRTVRTGLTQDQWLYFYWPTLAGQDTATAELWVKHYHEDGTDATFMFDDFAVDVHEVWMVPAGRVQLGLDAIEVIAGSPILKYELWVKAMVGIYNLQVSETKTFLVDWEYYEFETEMQYRNGLGTMTQLLLRGRPEKETATKKEEAEAYHQLGMNDYLGNTMVHAVEVKDGVNHASGLLNAAELKQFRELLASTQVMVKDASLGWVKVNVMTSNISDDPLDNVRRVTLEHVPGWQNEVVNMF